MAGRLASAAAMNRCHAVAGHVPPVTRSGVAGGTIERVPSSGNPIHTAVASSGV